MLKITFRVNDRTKFGVRQQESGLWTDNDNFCQKQNKLGQLEKY